MPDGHPGWITSGSDGALWFTDLDLGIGRLTVDGVLTTYPLADDPAYITTGPDGNLWFTQYFAQAVGRITPSGDVTLFPLRSGSYPRGITAGPDGNVWVAGQGSDRILRITPTGEIKRFPVTPHSGPFQISAGPDGNLWFTETYDPSIGRLTPAGVLTEFDLPNALVAMGITEGPDGNVWFTESFGASVGSHHTRWSGDRVHGHDIRVERRHHRRTRRPHLVHHGLARPDRALRRPVRAGARPGRAATVHRMSANPNRRTAVVTVSDGVSAGVRDDASGRALAALLSDQRFDVERHEIVPDERGRIEPLLFELSDAGFALVVTTGGTGLGPRDVTPEATRAVIEREAPGLAEAMRAAGRAITPFSALSREVVGSRGSTLIVNLPGSEKGAVESLTAILPVLPHALDLLAGETVHGPADATGADDEHAEYEHRGVAVGVGADAGDLEAELVARRAAGEQVVLATAVRAEGNPPCRVGQKLLVGPDGPIAGTLGCAEFDASALEGARRAMERGEPTTETYQHDLGTIEVYLEPTVRRPRLILFSATPVAAAMIRWGRELGFEPLLIEPRAERLGSFEDGETPTAPTLENIVVDAGTYAVHTDHDAPGVAESVASLLRSPARYVGVMGSVRHVGPHVETLRAQGFTDDDLARIRTPVGLNIGAQSAEEIALSILAGLVAARHDRPGGWLDR